MQPIHSTKKPSIVPLLNVGQSKRLLSRMRDVKLIEKEFPLNNTLVSYRECFESTNRFFTPK